MPGKPNDNTKVATKTQPKDIKKGPPKPQNPTNPKTPKPLDNDKLFLNFNNYFIDSIFNL